MLACAPVCDSVSYFGSLLAIIGHLFDGHHLVGVGVTCLEKKTERSDFSKVLNETHTVILSQDITGLLQVLLGPLAITLYKKNLASIN